MASGLIVYIVVGIQLLGMCPLYAEVNPCTDYTELSNDTLQASVQTVGWYRFVSTKSGRLATLCPDEDTCSSPEGVMWTNDTPPAGMEGYVTLCVKQEADCCYRKTTIQMKTCTGYTVYQLGPSTQGVFCFDTSDALQVKAIESTPESSLGHMQERKAQITAPSIARETSQTTTLTIPSEELSDWLSNSTSTNETTTKPDEEDDDDKSWLATTIVVSIIAVIVLIAVVKIIRWRMIQGRKKKAGVVKTKAVVDINRKTSTV